MATSNSAKKSSSTVSYKDALKVGLVCGVAVLILSIIVTRAWQDSDAFGYAFIYAGIAFVLVSALSAVLNWVMRNDTQNDDQSYPVLK
ncbi:MULTISPECIES: hypothetical protein [Brevibacterium]|uniref:Uncharacterized protein n=1 Tax=Brevibacterium casei TaxID=33889 RepID=A0A7T4A099_9MICO|nr:MULTISPECIES: hypothetical protein [Brevibacterium]MCM1010994.1 hypothetical protein [Brevibacterium sp. XM4083]QQB14936.1 hypothetical protein I6H47_02875 [Brevibacterium casei]